MTAIDRLETLLSDLGTATSALDNVRGVVQEVENDPFVAAADPALLEAKNEAAKALQHAEAAIAHLDRLKQRCQSPRAA